MRWISKLLALLALVVPAGLSAQQRGVEPACRASLDGDRLTTVIEFPDGYAVEAPWRVTWNRAAALEDGRPGVVAGVELDRIIERDPATGQRVETPFPEPIQTTFEGATEEQMVYRAAQIWCLTVLKAQNGAAESKQQGKPKSGTARTVGP